MSVQRYAVELREASLNKGTLTGHAAVFGQFASLPGHYEAIARTAFDAVLANDPDVRALINHDPSMLLARTTNGSLRLSTDDVGLRFDMDLPDTSYARDLRELVERGLLTGMSFGFLPGDDEWSTAKDGRRLRTHTNIRALLDVSPVTFPAYQGTDVALRSLDIRPGDNRSKLIRARARLLRG